ncbi:MAG: 2-oxoglutarate dehydrogenase complex dihydrolipoyllysine-residue succinyltransferase [gamma proteobacterium symbiont of Lucinoma myriamae]|nr:2-oxoglutarate dehydrogenase complex dihydrolipoyllysine-residue succinyltransferase [gamma proteobacterium symbiont of Lucinoma myriamae]MCU7817901.1 2-oxoglutarate dehydrogenase complex dihydrolipoyllysine-residue succinyltransferase [gamma proteobacterium symbiont of Lucinoma myriamae]
MAVEIKTPTLPESVADALVVSWLKKPGEQVALDEILVEIETDKVILEIPSPLNGVLESIVEKDGATVISEQLLGYIKEGTVNKNEQSDIPDIIENNSDKETKTTINAQTSPAVRKELRENNLNSADITGSGKNGRILNEDVQAVVQSASSASTESISINNDVNTDGRIEQRVPMTRLRKRIAERLQEASQSTAMLTTFNEVNMQPLMDMRNQYKELFEKTHNARLGFMSLFVKASTVALQRFPEVNASIDKDDIIYHSYCDIGIAVSSPRGLVVPILRNTEHMSMAQVESNIAGFAVKAKEGKLTMDELSGGTFTITNGGVFGSLFSTPILNPPQSAILGMHGINKRVVVENDEMVIRPMMYLALSYDHKIIDGQSAVLFLKTIKELVENPQRILLEV